MSKSHPDHHHNDIMQGHEGHEKLHTLLFFLLVFGIVTGQIGLYQWKKRRYSSFRNITLLGMWGIPMLLSLYNHYWRFVTIWAIFTLITCFIVSKALKKPIETTTPRQVYIWFYRIYQICSNVTILGYFLVMADYAFSPVNHNHERNPVPEPSHSLGSIGLLFVFYGVYFGVLGRDFSELCADWMAVTIGFTGKKEELPSKDINPKICGICAGKLLPPPEESSDEDDVHTDKTVVLNCDHKFHEWCIRGWTIVGKKDVCPYCCEKVDLSSRFVSPWEKQNILWGNILDAVRYLIVWNPIILFIINLLFQWMDPVVVPHEHEHQ